MFSMMMGNQRMMGVSPIPPDVQMMLNCAPTTRELLQRPEARAIIHGLQHGDITKQHIIEQLQVLISNKQNCNYFFSLVTYFGIFILWV